MALSTLANKQIEATGDVGREIDGFMKGDVTGPGHYSRKLTHKPFRASYRLFAKIYFSCRGAQKIIWNNKS